MAAKWRRDGDLRLSRTRNDHKLEQCGQSGRFAPLREQRDIVGADQVEQRRSREFFRVMPGGIDGVRDRTALNFLEVETGPILTGEGQTKKPCAFGRGSRLMFRLEG